jgi:hypothetical protein
VRAVGHAMVLGLAQAAAQCSGVDVRRVGAGEVAEAASASVALASRHAALKQFSGVDVQRPADAAGAL